MSMMNGIDLAHFAPPPPHLGKGTRAALREEWRVENDQYLALFVGNNWRLKGAGEALEGWHGWRPKGTGGRW